MVSTQCAANFWEAVLLAPKRPLVLAQPPAQLEPSMGHGAPSFLAHQLPNTYKHNNSNPNTYKYKNPNSNPYKYSNSNKNSNSYKYNHKNTDTNTHNPIFNF